MRVINEKHETITEYDLSLGFLATAIVIKEDATPIDNITKFAYADDDYERVQIYHPFPEKTIPEQIQELEKVLSNSDYKVIKCIEYTLSGQSLPYSIKDLHNERQAIRDKINELKGGA